MFNELLNKKKSEITGKWIRLIFDSYPGETSKFLKHEKNRFSNPVGYAISTNMIEIFDELINSPSPGIIKPLLIDIIKIRAVQNFSASQAVGFIFSLKDIIRDELKDELKDEKIFSEMLGFENKIDRTALMAFDIYQDCRERIYRIQLNEIRSGMAGIAV